MVAQNITLRVGGDPAEWEQVIVRFLKDYFAGARVSRAVVGLSGGIDSAVSAALGVRALGAENIMGLVLPTKNTSETDMADARAVADALGIEHRVVDVQPALDALDAADPGFMRETRGNAAARLRMTILHEHAQREKALVLGTGNKSEVLTGYFCLDAETRAVTTTGIKTYEQLEPDDLVYSIDIQRGVTVTSRVESVHVFPYTGPMIRIRHRSINLKVTPDHRMLVRRNHGRGALGFCTATEIMAGHAVDVPTRLPFDGPDRQHAIMDTAKYLGQSQLSRNANKPPKMTYRDFLYLLGLYIGDGHLEEARVTVPLRSNATWVQQMQNRDAGGRFATLPAPPGGSREYITQRVGISAHEAGRSRRPLLRVLDRYGMHSTESPTQVLFSNKAVFLGLDEAGRGARGKQLPPWVFELPVLYQRSLFQGLMDSDGAANGTAYYTVNETLAYQVAQLCFHLGYHPSIRRRKARTTVRRDGVKIRSSAAFEVGISRKRRTMTIKPRHCREDFYDGVVWCPGVPPHENLLVERNGSFCFTGNTKFGDGGVDVQPIGDLYKTQVRALAEHLNLPEAVRSKTPSAGLWEGQTDEGELGMTYEVLDRVLLGIEIRLPHATIAEALDVPQAEIERIARIRAMSQHKRRMPMAPKFGLRTSGLDWRDATYG